MKCYANQLSGGVCVSRQGKVLSQMEFDNIEDAVPDKDICRHRVGSVCTFGAPVSPVIPRPEDVV